MPRSWDNLEIPLPEFENVDVFLKACGKIVLDQIVSGIQNERRPDGMPQKRNSPDYEDRKAKLMGYRTPVMGINRRGSDRSPYLGRRSLVAWRRDMISPTQLLIHVGPRREEAIHNLVEKGYWVVGITVEAERRILQRTYNYLREAIRKMAEKAKR